MKRFLRLRAPLGRVCACFLAVILLTVFVIIPFSACNSIKPGEKQATVYIATDLHLYSDDLLSDDNEVYIKENLSNDGRVQECDYEIVTALIDEVREAEADYLILTGDLSYNGEEDSHRELVRLLEGVGDKTQVLVIPGNHDTYSQNSFSAVNDEYTRISSIDADKFREIYSDFGYTGAYSYDETSLSYFWALDDDTWALMLDTSQSRYNEEAGMNIVGGYLEESTLKWVEGNLEYAKNNGISVISFSHHNLLVHNELFESRYTLSNNSALLELYSKYGVSLNFSGHLHIQSIESTEVEEQEIYDVAGGSLLDYGNRYGVLDIYDNCYSYESRRLELTSSGELAEYSFDVFYREYYDKTVDTYRKTLGDGDGEKATDLLARINAYYFDGNYKEIHRELDRNRRLVELIKNNTANYDTSYVGSIIEVPKQNQHTLLIER